MKQRSRDRRKRHETESDERRSRAEEAVKRVGGVDRAEGARDARRGKNAGDIGAVQPRNGIETGRRVSPSQDFSCADKRGGHDEAENDTDPRTEVTLLDGIAHQQDRAERKSRAADPDGPSGPERLLEARSCAGDLRRRLRRLVRNRRRFRNKGIDRVGRQSRRRFSRRSGGRLLNGFLCRGGVQIRLGRR